MRRLHPLAGISQALGHGVQGLGVPIFAYAMLSFALDIPISVVFVAAPIGGLLGAGYGAASYLRFEYELSEDALVVASGVLARREREIPYGRIQNVDVRRRVLLRLIGAAAVSIETAGGGSTEASFDFVHRDEAERIQTTVRKRRRAAQDEAAASETEEQGAGESPSVSAPGNASEARSEALFALTPVELAVYALATFRPAAVPLALIAASVAPGAVSDFVGSLAPAGVPTSLAELTVEQALVGTVFYGPLTAVGAYAVSAAFGAVSYYGFMLVREGDDLRYERGLLQRYSGAIPLSKVQTLTVTEPVVMRVLGYAGLAVETAGYTPTDGGDGVGSGAPSAVPAAKAATTLALARRIEPFGGLDTTVERPPKRARRRYVVRYALLAAGIVAAAYAAAWALGGGPWYVAFLAFVPVLPAAHLKWANLGYRAGEDHLVLREGFWRRQTHVVPYERLQTVNRERSVFQRRLGLATLVADTASSATLVSSAPSAIDIDDERAADLYDTCRERLQQRLGAR